MVGAFLGLFVGFFFMGAQMVYPPAKSMPPVSMIGCSANSTITERFIYPPNPVYE